MQPDLPLHQRRETLRPRRLDLCGERGQGLLGPFEAHLAGLASSARTLSERAVQVLLPRMPRRSGVDGVAGGYAPIFNGVKQGVSLSTGSEHPHATALRR